MTLFKPVYLDQRVALTPSDLRKASDDIDAFLLEKISKDIEGQCCTHGYVLSGSTEILARSMGQAEHGRFTGDFIFNCKIKISCLLPSADQVVEGRILKMNKLGGYALLVDEGKLHEAMRIILPRDLHRGNADFDRITVGQGVRIRLLRSRFQAKDAFIQAVGTFEGLVHQVIHEGNGSEGQEGKEGSEGEAGMLQPAVAETEAAIDVPMSFGEAVQQSA